jgi:hypothetical protein
VSALAQEATVAAVSIVAWAAAHRYLHLRLGKGVTAPARLRRAGGAPAVVLTVLVPTGVLAAQYANPHFLVVREEAEGGSACRVELAVRVSALVFSDDPVLRRELGLSLGWWVDLIHAWEKVVVVSTDRVAVGAQCADRAVCVFGP